ncbi:uncharacterized protein LOC144116015 isoform X2 [Amblyomma americanum]
MVLYSAAMNAPQRCIEFKIEKAMYDTVKGISKDAVFHKRTTIPIWSTEAVVLCNSSGKCSGGDSGRHCGYTAGVKLLSGKYNLFDFARKDARYDARGLHLDYAANFSTNEAKDAFVQNQKVITHWK